MSDTYYHTSSVSLRSAALQFSLENRLALQLNTVGSMIYTQKWKRITTPSGRSLLAHTASARRTSGNDCTGWQTPSVTIINERSEESMEKRTAARLATGRTSLSPGNLAEQVQMYAGWCTPMSQDHSRGSKPPRPHDTGIPLSQQVALAGWATPNTMDVLPARSPEALYRIARGRTFPANLREQVDPAQQQIYQDAKNGKELTGSTAGTTNTGQLNPGLSRWLMGFPVEWCIAAIRSTRKNLVP